MRHHPLQVRRSLAALVLALAASALPTGAAAAGSAHAASAPRPASTAPGSTPAPPVRSATASPAPAADRVPAEGLAYRPSPPARIVDTRIGLGLAGPLGPGQTASFAVRGQGGVPLAALGVALNVTITGATSPAGSYLVVWRGDQPRPGTSSLNFSSGMVLASLVITALGDDGRAAVYNQLGSVQVIADVEGWYEAAGGGTGGNLSPLIGARILDTRTGNGRAAGRIGGGETVTVPVLGRGNVPAYGVTGVIANLTVTNPASYGYVQAMPAGGTPGSTSTLNFSAGQTLSNRVIVQLGAGGAIALYNDHSVDDLVVDVVGWIGGAPGGTTELQQPARILDTRTGLGGRSGPLGSRSSVRFAVAGTGGAPAGISAAILNVTVTNAHCPSYVTAYPGTATLPFASDLNFAPGPSVANIAVVKLGSDGTAQLYNGSCAVDVVADLLGWIVGAAALGFPPSAPTISAVAGSGPLHVMVSWSPPIVTGRQDITGYTIWSAELGVIGAVEGTASSTLVPVTCGSTYSITVTAVNGSASGAPASASGRTPDCYNIILDVPYRAQQYSLSCEAAALQMALAHEGIAVDQATELNDMGIDLRPAYYDAAGLRWGDPYTSFVGNPNGSEVDLSGYGTYDTNVARIAAGYGARVIVAGEQMSASDVYLYLLQGHPVVAWVAFDWRYHAPGAYLAFDGRSVPYAGPVEHTVTLVGISPDSVYVYNPLSGPQWVSRSAFESAFATYSNMVVVLD